METTRIKSAPPFFANTQDDKHCFQAAFRIILAYFLPHRNFSWQELETMSAMQKGKATWPQQMLLNLHNMGFEVYLIEGFDGRTFIKEGAHYLRRAFGEKTSDWQIKNSDIEQEQRIYQKALDAGVKIEKRIPKFIEFNKYLKAGFLTTCTVNSRLLNDQEGYVGHSVVVYGVDDKNVTFHDPGLPPHEARKISHKKFIAAWADPNDEAREIIAIRYRGEHG